MLKKYFIIFYFISLIIAPVLVLAQTATNPEASTEQSAEAPAPEGIQFKPSINIPGSIFTDTITVKEDTLARYIVAVYSYGGIFAGVVAMFMLVYAGWEWLLAGGNSSKISSAKGKISATLIGLALLFGGYILLSLISKNLIAFDSLNTTLPDLKTTCPTLKQSKPCTDAGCVWTPPTAKQLEEAPTVTGYCTDVSSVGCASDALVKDFSISKIREDHLNCTDCRLTIETINALKSVAEDLDDNQTLTIKSAYRSTAKQAELYACYQNVLNGNPCSSDCESCNKASPPDCDSAHQTGRAVDICIQIGSSNSCGYIDEDGEYHSYISEQYNCDRSTNQPAGLCAAQTILRQKMRNAGFDPYDGADGEWWHFVLRAEP